MSGNRGTIRGMWRIIFSIGLFCSLLGCDEAELQAGEAGAECRLGPEPCADGLTCLNGRCQAGSQDQGQAPLEVVFTIADRYLAADGESRTAILVEANDADGEPYEGELLVFPSPLEAGRMDPPIIQFVGGLAQTDYVACRTGGPLPCPEYVTVYAAFTSAPLEAFAQSAPIRLFDETATFMSQVSDDGCEAGLGRVAYRNDLSVGAERLETFGVGSTNFDSDGEVLRLQLEQAVVAMRFAPDSVDSGTLTLRAEDLAVTSAEVLEMPSPCDQETGNAWTGTLVLRDAELIDGNLNSLDLSIELTCIGADGTTAGIRACANFDSSGGN